MCVDSCPDVIYHRHTFPGESFPGNLAPEGCLAASAGISVVFLLVKWCFNSVYLQSRELMRKERR